MKKIIQICLISIVCLTLVTPSKIFADIQSGIDISSITYDKLRVNQESTLRVKVSLVNVKGINEDMTYDLETHPAEDVIVEMNYSKDDFSKNITLEHAGQGYYEADVQFNQEGEWKVEVTATLKEANMDTEHGHTDTGEEEHSHDEYKTSDSFEATLKVKNSTADSSESVSKQDGGHLNYILLLSAFVLLIAVVILTRKKLKTFWKKE